MIRKKVMADGRRFSTRQFTAVGVAIGFLARIAFTTTRRRLETFRNAGDEAMVVRLHPKCVHNGHGGGDDKE